ncbi:MAG TPA: calcium-binding protein, partial [Hyphomicrobiaceae bacterium]|nr:calcium-binding protein [Hyphomicrobiaceae bacterium]
SSEGDDTIYGDAGHDRLEGGYGNDIMRGGTGDDIITDIGGDDLMQGEDGNDVLHGGQGVNLLIGGFGNDFIINNEDIGEWFGGAGDDYILGNRANEEGTGGEGDDWIEFGTPDGGAGDNADAFARDQIVGNDVFIGDSISDRMDGEGGDDILVGNHGGGEGDRYLGKSGYDWAVFKDDPFGVTVDFNIRAFDETTVPRSNNAVLARFESMEGLSGSHHADILQGDDADAAAIAISGFTGSVLTNFLLIDGLQAFVGAGVTAFGSGNIILGGEGSDIMEGRGGDDLIDGDRWLNVRIGVFNALGEEIDSFDSMEPLVPLMVNGIYNPGQLRIVREILPGDAEATDNFDTVYFSGLRADYTITIDANSTLDDPTDDIVTVTDNVGTDGIDRLTNVERLQFTDQKVILVPDVNAEPVGLLTISDATPEENQVLSVSIAGVADADNPAGGAITGPVSYFWEVEEDPGSGRFATILIDNVGGELVRATGPSFTVTPELAGLSLRVRAIYKDANGVLETVFSAPTAAVTNVNALPVGTVVISDPTPTEGQFITASNLFTDADGLLGVIFSYQWQRLDGPNPNNPADWTNVGAASPVAQFVASQTEVGHRLRVIVSYTDNQGTLETVTSAPTDIVGDLLVGTNAANNIAGTEADDRILGEGGNDTLNGLGGSDILEGGAGNDVLNGGLGNDQMRGGAGNDTYLVDDAGDQVIENLNEGNDRVQTTLAAYTLTANVETLTFTGTDSFTGSGNAIANTITGGIGNDVLSGLAGNDSLNGGDGNDALSGGADNDTLTGGTGNDSLTGGDGTDSLNGGAGDDLLAGGVGSDVLAGGAGNDTASYDGEADAMVVDLSPATGTARRGSGANPVEDTLTAVENVTGGSNGDTITGSAVANILAGGGGHDTLSGLGGNDTIRGDAGNDAITGGAGNDVLSGGAGNDSFSYAMGEGGDQVDGGAGTDTLTITGGTGNETLDVIYAGAVLTTFEGGTLTDVESVIANLGGGTDRLTYAGTTTGVTVNLALGTASGFSSIAGIESVIGGSGDDVLTANGVADTLSGGAGNDSLTGTGNDVLIGGVGDDTYVAVSGDTITEAGGAGNDSVFTTSNVFTLTANVENLTFTGAGGFTGTGNGSDNVITGGGSADVLSGAGGNDQLIGGEGADNLSGGAGNDVLTGDAGNDVMTGGAGADTFVFGAGFGDDTINGFDANPTGGQDLIDISAYGFSELAGNVIIDDLGTDMLVTIGADTIRLVGVSGLGANTITIDDFLLN